MALDKNDFDYDSICFDLKIALIAWFDLSLRFWIKIISLKSAKGLYKKKLFPECEALLTI